MDLQSGAEGLEPGGGLLIIQPPGGPRARDDDARSTTSSTTSHAFAMAHHPPEVGASPAWGVGRGGPREKSIAGADAWLRFREEQEWSLTQWSTLELGSEQATIKELMKSTRHLMVKHWKARFFYGDLDLAQMFFNRRARPPELSPLLPVEPERVGAESRQPSEASPPP